jgi:eukaryotic-like serine/threonine-protein kinase
MTDNKKKNVEPAFQKGQKIGQYQVVGTLHVEALTDTYLALQLPQNTPMQVEVVRPPLMSELQKGFMTQVHDFMQLEHPHILRLQDVGIENHYPFLVTNYVARRSLRDAYPHGNVMTLQKVLLYSKQVTSALQYMHEHKILHGNLQPESILLDENDQVLLHGFTINAITENREQLNYHRAEAISKAIAYTAPEQIRGKSLAASDQYALAIIVYELLSGTLPFTGSYIEIADKQKNILPPSLKQKAPAVSTRLENVLMKALAKDPTQRFPDIRSFMNALEQEQTARSQPVPGLRMPPPPVPPRSTMSPPATLPATVAVPSQPPYNASPAQQPPAGNAAFPAPVQRPAYDISQNPVPPVQSPPAQAAFAVNAPLAPITPAALAPRRRDGNTMTRRAFAVGLVGLAAVGGAGGWYVLSKRLTRTSAPVITPNEVTPATPITVNKTNALIFTGHLAPVNAVTWSPDGSLLASASDDKFVQIFDAVSGKRKLIYSDHTEEVAAVAWSPNGNFIASAGQDRTAQIWNADNGSKLQVYTGHTDRINAVAWSNNGQSIASGSEDKTVQIWNVGNTKLLFNFHGHTAGVLCVGWQPDNSSVASGSWDGTLRDWATIQHGNHFNAGEQIFSYGGHGKNEVNGLAWSPDGFYIASAGADQTVQFSNGTDGLPRPQFFTGHENKSHRNPVRSVDWSPDGNFMVSGDTDGNVLVWRVVGRKTVFTYQGHKGAVNAVAWSPDGKKIASASADNTVHVWQPF